MVVPKAVPNQEGSKHDKEQMDVDKEEAGKQVTGR